MNKTVTNRTYSFLAAVFLCTSFIHADTHQTIKNAFTSIGQAIEYKNLKIFPILNEKKSRENSEHYITLDQASQDGSIQIKEIGSGTINTVKIKNNGSKPVIIMNGEIISGAKQDRMLSKDVLLPAKSTWIKIPVYCVEHGRWNHVSPEFKSEKLIVPNSVRKKAKLTGNQSAVWSEVSSLQHKEGIHSKTSNVVANYKDKNIKADIDEYVQHLATVPALSESMVGIIVTTGDDIICVDIFANNELLAAQWDKLLKSYAMDARSSKKGTVEKEEVHNLLRAVVASHQTKDKTPGQGKLIKLESAEGKGSALLDDKNLIHLNFFPKTEDDLNNDSENTSIASPRQRSSFLTRETSH